MDPLKKTVITLFGVRGSGKDTVGDLLRDRYGYRKKAFADPLKAMAKLAFPAFTEEDLYGPSSRRNTEYTQYPMGDSCLRCNGPLFNNDKGGLSCVEPGCMDDYPLHVSPRIALVTLGTEWGRRLYKNVWIDNAFQRIDNSIRSDEAIVQANDHLYGPGTSMHYRFVITDGRFVNEFNRVTELGSFTVLLLRGLEESTDTHPSEAEIKLIPRERFGHVLDNRGGLDELPGLVSKMLAKVR